VSAGAAAPGRAIARMRRHPGLTAGAGILAAVVLVGLAAPLIAPYDPLAQDLTRRLAAPSRDHLLGTDHLGRDLLSRLVYGTRISVLVGMGAILASAVAGGTLGLIGGYFARWPDRAVVTLVDVFLSFPTFLLALAFVAVLGAGLTNVVAAIALAMWPGVARVVRAGVVDVRGQDFVEAARSAGAGDLRILRRHILPNAHGAATVVLTLSVGTAVLSEASLGFLGLGVAPPTATWGRVVGEGVAHMRTAPWAVLSGGLAIGLTVLGLNLLGDGLRDLLDPTFRGTGQASEPRAPRSRVRPTRR
jgi:peptide/nickel transport system permease protein